MDSIGSELEALAPYFSVARAGGVVVLRLTDDAIYVALDLESKRALWRLFDAASASDAVRALVLVGTASCFGAAQVDRFWRHVLHHGAPGADLPTPHASRGEMDVHREGTGHQQFAAKVRGCRKAVVVGFQGEVCTPFLGNGLVCDYRVAAEGTVFRNRCRELGMPPGGALARLLALYVGFGTASELLLEGRDIPADEALALGLVNRVVPPAELEAAALGAARRMADMSPQAFAATKQLLTDCLGGLDDHFRLESQLTDACLPSLRVDELVPDD